MKYHIRRSEIKWKSRDDEPQLIKRIFYKGNGERRIVSSYKKNFEGLNEHKIMEILTKNIYTKHYNYLLFYHWYERKYKVNIIEDFNNSILETPIHDNSVVPSVRTRNKKLEFELRDLVIHNIGSTTFKGYSVFYEYYYYFFPNIEQFSLEEIIGEEFLLYFLELFPFVKHVYHDNGKYDRFKKSSLPNPEYLFEREYGFEILRYNKGLPCFYPRIPDNQHLLQHTHNPLVLMEKSVRELEDVVRVSKGLPKIGEGWISETTLYYELKNHFVDLDVQHHGQPNWLGLQHIDIWFPKFRIGVEFQGIQHDKPIDFFGGVEGFKNAIERDIKKKRLFKENDSVLIEVRPNYNLKDVIKQIELHINRSVGVIGDI